MTTFQRTLDIVKNIEKQAKAKSKKVEQPTNIVQLPIWPDPVRAVPNVCLRSALFSALYKESNQIMRREIIYAQGDYKIIYTGGKLDQTDLDIWETVLHICRLQALGNECRFTAYQFLKLLGKPDTKFYRDVLEDRLSKLKATGVDIQNKRYGYEGSLIDEVYRDKETLEYVVILNSKLKNLFEKNEYTQVEWQERQALGSQSLAKWLHGYYSSHADPYPIKIETLHKLSGSETKELWKFKQNLIKALDTLKEVLIGFSYQITGDLVHIDRKPSGSQKRHLNRKKPIK